MVSPAPRSKKRTSRVWRSTTRTKETLVRCGEARMPLQLGSQRAPVEIEIRDEDGALRISDVQDHRFAVRHEAECSSSMSRRSHVHLEANRPDCTLVPELQMFDARRRSGYGSPAGGRGRSRSKRRRAARAVAGDFAVAAVGVVQFDCGIRVRQAETTESSRRRRRRMYGRRSRGRPRRNPRRRQGSFAPGEKKIVARAVRLYERDGDHGWR